MLRILTKKADIKKAQQTLTKKMNGHVDEKIFITAGYSGGSLKAKVSWSSTLGMWFYLGHKEKNRFVNLFGIGEKPKAGLNKTINVEVNIPFEGVNRRVGGAFAIDERGKLYLVHRGKIGGGKKGIGKKLFNAHYRGSRVDLEDGNRTSEVALIDTLESKTIGERISRLAVEVKRIKSLTPSEKKQQSRLNDRFKPEFSGTKKYSVSRIITAQCNHGIVVDALYNQLAKTYPNKAYRSKPLDLFIKNKNLITRIYEIKTDTSTTSVYTAIGQLLFHGANIKKPPELFFVVLDDISKKSVNSIKKLGINVLKYRWVMGDVVFMSPI